MGFVTAVLRVGLCSVSVLLLLLLLSRVLWAGPLLWVVGVVAVLAGWVAGG